MDAIGLGVGVISGAASGAAAAALAQWLPGRLEQECRRDALEVLGLTADQAPPPASPEEEGFQSPWWAWVIIGGAFGALLGVGPMTGPLMLTAGCLLLSGLLCSAAVDFRSHWLPDIITLPLLWAGLLLAAATQADVSDKVLGAAAGYGALFAINQIYRLRSGQDAIGGGDLKLLAAIGAWGGTAILPTVVIGGSILGAIVGAFLMLRGSHESTSAFPFGPCLAAIGALTILGGEPVLGSYVSLIGGR